MDSVDRKSLVRYKRKEKMTYRVALVVTCADLLTDITAIFQNHLKTLHMSDKMSRL